MTSKLKGSIKRSERGTKVFAGIIMGDDGGFLHIYGAMTCK